MNLRILVLGDTHLGFDESLSPRVRRRRRGPDFMASFKAALVPALRREVDAVIHLGDVFHRPSPPPSLVFQAFRLLEPVVASGIPVFVVPGNHERGRIPHVGIARDAGVSVFSAPRSFTAAVRGVRLVVSGFPYVRRVRQEARGLMVRLAGIAAPGPRVHLLCLHHAVEGAVVGPSDFTFSRGDDVIRAADLPQGVAAVVSGHIHRHQVLERDLGGRHLPVPVLYPGSTERTSFVEREETKGYLLLRIRPDDRGGSLSSWEFRPLPTRPMRALEVALGRDGGERVEAQLARALAALPEDAVVRVRIRGAGPGAPPLSAERLRQLAPPTMNVEWRHAGARQARRPAARPPSLFDIP